MNLLKQSFKNQSGQLVVEAILLMIVLLGMSFLVSQYLKDSQFAKKLTAEPWARLTGMIECGTWQNCRGGLRGLHPSTGDRIMSLRTEDKVK